MQDVEEDKRKWAEELNLCHLREMFLYKANPISHFSYLPKLTPTQLFSPLSPSHSPCIPFYSFLDACVWPLSSTYFSMPVTVPTIPVLFHCYISILHTPLIPTTMLSHSPYHPPHAFPLFLLLFTPVPTTQSTNSTPMSKTRTFNTHCYPLHPSPCSYLRFPSNHS